ncbi:putative acyl-CoA dehydrogenase IBR3 [Hibiscus syriacus]|uniref:Acyl-CoA dehydrogenase IBR3 n=1 Tax=Hibiscus syriacus TaxID=106335 RepID=A0A6A3D0F5_HIBSY|nr:putative acyl-CoA dehydrogenase IBR3 [Hibiscus syriacus]
MVGDLGIQTIGTERQVNSSGGATVAEELGFLTVSDKGARAVVSMGLVYHGKPWHDLKWSATTSTKEGSNRQKLSTTKQHRLAATQAIRVFPYERSTLPQPYTTDARPPRRRERAKAHGFHKPMRFNDDDGDGELPRYMNEDRRSKTLPTRPDDESEGRAWPASQWKFYVAFSMFRGASIYAGVYDRWLMGNASGGKRAEHTGHHANSLIDSALAFIAKKTVLPEQPPSAASQKLLKKHHLVSQGRRQHETENKVQGVPEGSGRFIPSKKVQDLRNKLIQFMEDHIYPMEEEFSKLARSDLRWTVHPEEESLIVLLGQRNSFNGSVNTDYANDLFLGAGHSNLEYGYLCEIMGLSLWAPQIFNCGAPETGNMEVLLRYGTKEQLNEWLVPLLEGTIRSAFAMTEPQVASSDATNIEEGDSYVINGTKWWTSGAMDPRCRILILMNVRVPAKNILLGEGRGFEIAQGRLGPGRLHHCMRMIGAAERGMQLMAQRALHRKTFGKYIAQHELEQARLLVLEAADQLDRLGNKHARGTIAMAKVAALNMALKVLDMAIQVHGGAGVSSDTVLAHMWKAARTLRIVMKQNAGIIHYKILLHFFIDHRCFVSLL